MRGSQPPWYGQSEGQEVTRAHENEALLLGGPTRTEGVPASSFHGDCGHAREAHTMLIASCWQQAPLHRGVPAPSQ